MNKKISSLLIVLFIASAACAQRPAPADTTRERILLLGAMAHVGNGQVIEISAIGMAYGKIQFAMDARGFKPNPLAFDTIIDVSGKHIYPGFIALNTNLGLSEIELVRATNDFRESGRMNPGARALIAYNTDSRVIPTVRDNGVLLAQIVPQGGVISGSSSVVQLDAWNYEDAAVKADEGIWINWPSMRIWRSGWSEPEEDQTSKTEKALRELKHYFNDAKAYHLQSPAVKNTHFEAMRGLFNGSRKLYVRCDYARDIIEAVRFAEEYNLKMVIAGGADSWRVAPLLRENNIPVIITRTHSLPYREDEDVDLPYKLPALLKEAGVTFAIADDGFWQQRNLAFQAGTAAGYGISREEALQSITLTPARILGIDRDCGSLEDGKEATLFISSGDALDMSGNKIEKAYISGREIDLDNYQKELYRRYTKKYGQ